MAHKIFVKEEAIIHILWKIEALIGPVWDTELLNEITQVFGF